MQQLIFQRQGRGRVGQIGVHAGGIGVDIGANFGVERRVIRLGQAVKAQHPHLAVETQPHLANQLRQAALADAALGLHLPQPVAGMDPAQRAIGVAQRSGEDVGNGILVPGQLDRRCQSRQRHRAGGRRRR